MQTLAPLTTLQRFLRSEQAGGVALVFSTVVSLMLANSSFGPQYSGFWHAPLASLTVEQWVNDGLMTIFFLLIGLEIERELYVGELSSPKNALLPIVAAVGGMVAPALIHFAFNGGTDTQAGFGIPMATDIAFAVGVFALLGNRVPTSLKVFVVAFAVMDDLGAVLVIALFYTSDLSLVHLAGSLAVWLALIVLNRLRVMALLPYLVGGVIMWYLMLRSGVHATVAGILLAFAIPFSAASEDEHSPSHKLENFLHRPVAFVVLPIFALANTGIAIPPDWYAVLSSPNSLGILAGLLVGKPAGIVGFCLLAVLLGICRLPPYVSWRQMVGAGILGGIGFTMSIFITNLAFGGMPEVVSGSKMAVFAASVCAAVGGFAWLKFSPRDPGSAAQEA